MGFTKGFTFIIITLLFQNIIFIPLLIALAVSGFKFYKSIIKDRRKENIKISFTRHTIFSILILIGLSVSSLIEVFISTNLLKMYQHISYKTYLLKNVSTYKKISQI